MFESIFHGISEFFSDVLPHTFCVPCFLKGVAEGFAIGLVTLAAIAASPAWLAIALVVALTAVGIYGITKLVSNWHNMSDGQKSEVLGNIAGGIIAGKVGGALLAEDGATGSAAVVGEDVSNVQTITAEEANAPYVSKGWNAPYTEGTDVTKFTTDSEIDFVRVHGVDNQEGAFLVKADEIAGMSPEQIQDHLALSYTPTHFSDVSVPANTQMQTGSIAPQSDWGVGGGGVQYQLLDDIPSSSFSNMRPLQ
jgi:hypothetical protein